VENTPAKIHGVKYTGNASSPEIHPKIHPPGWEIHAVFDLDFASCGAPTYRRGSAKRNPQSEVLVCWFYLVVFNAV
jgi:hypothetical protein